ncbi:MAG TPA: AI-2E family transporter [Lacipirellulaceae bacterium]|nr:AI-2E family transporter [Lacipirellulaceae bacterium]
MPRVISFIVLLAIILLVGAIFFQVMAQFLVPLFLAAVLLVVFQPLHASTLIYLPRHPRICAFITTVLILLVVLLPIVWLGWNAYGELYNLYHKGQPSVAAAPIPAAPVQDGEETQSAPKGGLIDQLRGIAFDLRDDFKDLTTVELEDPTVEKGISWIQSFVATKVLSSVQFAIGTLIGLAIMVISLYYFLADGPQMISAVMHLSPLDPGYEKELLERFGQVSRAVVVATLLSAVVQGALAGLGYSFALPREAPVFLLTALTMVTAMVPFVGAAAIWVCVCGWVYLYGQRVVDGQLVIGDPLTAGILAVYCTIVVSGIDNVIKPFILHGQSKLHPLLALLSILGGVQVLGPVGILVGPMLVSFLQALLNMLRKELDSFSAVDVDATQQLAGIGRGSEQPAVEKNAPPNLGESASVDGNTTKNAEPAPSASKSAGRRRDRRKPGR